MPEKIAQIGQNQPVILARFLILIQRISRELINPPKNQPFSF
jgi:hypothetical protein